MLDHRMTVERLDAAKAQLRVMILDCLRELAEGRLGYRPGRLSRLCADLRELEAIG